MSKMTRKEYDKRIEQMIDDIKSQNFAFPNDTAEKKLERKNKDRYDFIFFKETYFPHYATIPSGKFHRDIHNITNYHNTINAIAGPRGFGKTVDIAVIDSIWRAINGDHKFQIICSLNELVASERNAAIRYEFMYNQNLIYDFGQQVGEGQGSDEKFTTKDGCRFLAIGYGQPIRGKIFRSKRPTRILFDDFEDHKARNPKIGREKLQYVTEEAFGAFGPEGGIILWLGNLTHKTSAFAMFHDRCEAEPENDKICFWLFKAIVALPSGGEESLWPEGFPLERLHEIKTTITTAAFERHYQMNPVQDGLKFKSSWFKYYNRYEFDISKCSRIITYVDPSQTATGDSKYVATWGFYEGCYYLLELWLRQASLDDMIHEMYARHKKYPQARMYMEITLQQYLWSLLPKFAEEYKYSIPVFGVENKIDKALRIDLLEPFFQRGYIFFYSDKDHDILYLEEQLTGYPDHPMKDGPDGTAKAVDLFATTTMDTSYQGQPRESNSFHAMH